MSSIKERFKLINDKISKKILYLIILILSLIIIFFLFSAKDDLGNTARTVSESIPDNSLIEDVETTVAKSVAAKEGEMLSHGNCEGEGPVTLTHSPMDYDDFAYIIPYGLVTGGHVTPIDHQYFSPTVWESEVDRYPVYALADATIVDIQFRYDEYRIVMMHTCTFFTYFDLVTSLSPEIKEEFEKNQNNNFAVLDISIKAGQEIGRIGGRTLDFAVWNMEYVLEGFATPSNYDGESWKIHTDDPYKYYSVDIVETLREKNLRTVDPIAGKIDHDVIGTIVGNWFIKGTGGYTGAEIGTSESDYWDTHLAIVPNHIDPTGFMFSVGDYVGEPTQWGISKDDISPLEVNLESGIVRYPLYEVDYIKEDGYPWGRQILEGPLTFDTHQYVAATALVQLVAEDELQVEVFTGSYWGEFTSNAKVYER